MERRKTFEGGRISADASEEFLQRSSPTAILLSSAGAKHDACWVKQALVVLALPIFSLLDLCHHARKMSNG